jgi:hypothetical protein
MYYRFPSFRPNPPSETKTAQECLTEILSKCDQRQRFGTSHTETTMPSSKGRPTDPELREEVKEEVKKGSKGMLLEPWTLPVHSSVRPEGPSRAGNKRLSGRLLLTTVSLGGGTGSWSAWKASEMARRYEARGGDYEDTGENKNKAQKGPPEKKSSGGSKKK